MIKKIVVKCLKKFKGVSVREETLKEQLKDEIKDIFARYTCYYNIKNR